MAVKIKLKRLGKIRQPYYRIVVADARTKRDGRAIEEIGKYHPKEEPSLIEVDSERVQYWLGVGAQPTEPVQRILELTGDWQRFKGAANATGSLKMPEPKPDRQAAYEAAVKEAHSEAEGAATTPKSKGRRKKAEGKGDAKQESKGKAKADNKGKADDKSEATVKEASDGKGKNKSDDKSKAKSKAKAKAESAESKSGA